MRKVCLLSALTMSDFGDPELTLTSGQKGFPPLGVLSLAAVLSDRGITPQIVDLNKLFSYFLKNDGDSRSFDFLTFVIQHLESLSFEIFGLSTICSSYPLTLRVAREVKRLHPSIQIVLGGPQASVVDIQTMESFPFIDFVVRGEAEDTFPLLLDALSGANISTELERLPGITFRRNIEIIRNPNAPPILDLDRLPLPAYHFDPNINEYKTIDLEIGRGCPFNCIFCSTNDFFNRRFRLKSPQKMIEQMKFIKDTYGINDINLLHDNFTTNREKVVEFCDALLKCGENFSWGCSSRTDRIDDELIALMAKAGCKGVFFGIETGSARLQQLINKKLNLSDAVMRIQSADQKGIEMHVSLITAFPDETKDDLRDTVNFIVDLLRFDNVESQLALLAPLAGTPICATYKDKLILDNIFSDMSFQGWRLDPADLEMIQANPEVFPNFYSIPTSHMNRMYFSEVRDFITALTEWFRWLPLALLQDNGDMLKIFDIWKIWLAKTNKLTDKLDFNATTVPYYCHKQFTKDFLEFVQTYYNNKSGAVKTVISAIIEIENLFLTSESGPTTQSPEEQGIFGLKSFPYKPAGLYIAQLNVDYKDLLQCLRNKKSLKQVSVKNVTVAFRMINQKKMKIEVRLLSPLSKELLDMCDGSLSVSNIIYQFALLKPHVDGVQSEKVCFFGLTQLFKQELIEISSRPINKGEKRNRFFRFPE
jgi:radical SAM superfamily enzyme YgiQ (UPF0313 family)